MTQLGKVCLTLGLVMAAAVGCDVNKTQEGEMPEVSVDGGQVPKYEVEKTQEGELPDVSVSGGQMPKYDVDTPDVDIEMEKREIEVPAVNINEDDDEDLE